MEPSSKIAHVPLNHQNLAHWSLASIDLEAKRIQYYDSMKDKDRSMRLSRFLAQHRERVFGERDMEFVN